VNNNHATTQRWKRRMPYLWTVGIVIFAMIAVVIAVLVMEPSASSFFKPWEQVIERLDAETPVDYQETTGLLLTFMARCRGTGARLTEEQKRAGEQLATSSESMLKAQKNFFSSAQVMLADKIRDGIPWSVQILPGYRARFARLQHAVDQHLQQWQGLADERSRALNAYRISCQF
jgi:hypothetical protein